MSAENKIKPQHNLQQGDLVVDSDWGSTGIWKWHHGELLNDRYTNHKLPDWLVERFKYWTGWYNSHAPWEGETIDYELHRAYGRSLAVDLKRVLGIKQGVFYGLKDEIILPDEEKVRSSIPPD